MISGVDGQLELVASVPEQRRGHLDPLFRWPGGKRWLVPKLLELTPRSFKRYFEPFFGAGALFFALGPSDAFLSDKNADLMACYRAIRDQHANVAAILAKLPRDQASYYRIRATRPTDDGERAARLIFLTTLAFNGIFRVNRNGDFNVPFGGRDYVGLEDTDRLRAYAEVLASAEIRSGDFEDALSSASAGDLVYLDPPYTVAHANNGFLKYNDRIFSWGDQCRLAAVATGLVERGCAVITSNAYHDSLVELYPGFRAIRVERMSVMAASSNRRRRIAEYLFTNLTDREPLEFGSR